MLYGLDNNLASPITSIILSLLLIAGNFFIGLVLIKFFTKLFKKKINLEFYFLSFVIGGYFILLSCYVFLSLNLFNIFIVKFISILILFIGFFGLLIFFQKYIINWKNNKFIIQFNLINILIFFIFLGLLLISLSPITHADSLDYHIQGAIRLVNNGFYNSQLLPMNNHLVGIGEAILSLGLVIGAEQYGSLFQLTSLLSLLPLLNKFSSSESNFSKLIFLLIITTPITIFLVSSPKPQLFYSVGSSLIFYSLLGSFQSQSIKVSKLLIFVFLLVLSVNYLVKYSFLLSSFLITLIIFYESFKKKILFYFFIYIFFLYLILIFPYHFNLLKNFNTTFISQIFYGPIPINIYGFKDFYNLLSGGSVNIINLIIPTNYSDFSTVFGPSLLLFFFMMSKKVYEDYKYNFFITLIFFLIIFFKGSNVTRFFYEGYIWLALITIKSWDNQNLKFQMLKLISIAQSILMLFIIYYYAINLFPGSLSQKLRTVVMAKYADGYKLAYWANKFLDKNDNIITFQRSISLYNSNTYSSIFTWFVDFQDKKGKIYIDFLKKKKINKIVFFGKEKYENPFGNCIGKKIAFKKNVGNRTGRNPFNIQKSYYDGWIYEFKYMNLPECIFKK